MYCGCKPKAIFRIGYFFDRVIAFFIVSILVVLLIIAFTPACSALFSTSSKSLSNASKSMCA